MSFFRKNYFFLLSILAVFLTYRMWFVVWEVVGGDWWYLHPSMLNFFNGLPELWNSQEGPFGGINVNFPFYFYAYFVIGVFVNIVGIPWEIASKLLYFSLFLLIGILSVHKLLTTVFKNSSSWQIAIGVLLYTTNTYILLVTSGGQMGIALAYSLAPFVLAKTIELTRLTNPFTTSLVLGLSLAVQVVFDIRITYLTIIACGIYVLVDWIRTGAGFKVIKYFCLAGFLMALLHAFWIIPFSIFDLLTVPKNITSVDNFDFFSFADFENAFGLLHPNWPENIFGKTYFMRWEHIVLPLFAFSSLLSVTRSIKTNTRTGYFGFYFIVLAILGIFMAKGTNDPFGTINRLIYQYIPGMNLFRDPTKFYLFVALAYTVLIPYSLTLFSDWFRQKFERKIPIAGYIFCGFCLFWLSLLKPVWNNELGGTFKERTVPQEYKALAAMLEDDTDFSRTFWVPTQSRFRYQSELHPLINSDNYFAPLDDDDHIAKLANPAMDDLLDALSVKYVILPFDSEQEIFSSDRKYDDTIRSRYEQTLDSLTWLTKIQDANLDLYENENFKEHLWVSDSPDFSWERFSSSEYYFVVNISEEQSLNFSETYHSGWQIKIGDTTIYPEETSYQTMVFKIPAGSYDGRIVFLPQQYAIYGYIISFITLGVTLYLILKNKKDTKA